ncbi:TonB-dependent receptor [Pseudoalteromonas peptidolytica]|uniref:Iron complex outermembrane recepter protein n=1 Tax=Pseudoalteromonas peptidolytica F12-50-A1 TaxID=1315280 RepID=A0A8I0MZT2_9GAMM|nr:TonB-dependent receptor [Pseudoalteromonas peptidolytica]MBE0348130.1 iron complex outermembrane recepter protein [Pseudoalteromonas peptidolytica F12-50-A1]NLR15529.1 TonB-dependent receptor [Pseudoalteromonas peptidolytica]GEK08507.1 TonB-dependent receptor [Pseudoalteromonas peptidolytica]
MNIYQPRYSAIALAITLATQVSPAAAEQAIQSQGKLERIEVTARKTVENLQTVPVAVTSIGETDLLENGISVLSEVQQFSPNTTLQASRGTNSTLTAFIRGVGQQDPLWGYEPGVGIYVDDIYLARPQGAVLDLLDVQQIEVLRGPQGTLYGKNTIGGAIKYVTKEMSGDATFNVEGTVGSYNQRDLKITGQLPLVEDTLYLGYGFATLNRDGFGEFKVSTLPGQDKENYNKEIQAARLTLEYRPSDDLFFRLAWDKTDDDSNSKGGYRLLPSLLTDAPVPDSIFDSYTSMPTWNKVELEGYSLTARWDLSDATTIKYIGASRDSYSPTNIDFDNTPLRIFDVPAIYDDEQTTHEIQLSHAGNGYKFVSGLYYYDGESCGQFQAILEVLGQSLDAPGLTREVSGCNNSNSKAAYIQGSIDLAEQWSLTLGARYTKDSKEAQVSNGLVFDIVYPESNWIPGYTRPAGELVPSVLDDEEDWSRFTPRVGVEYQYNRDIMFFASYAQGFKSGTFNPRASTAEPAADPEIVDSFEIGMKSEWNDNLRANITLFTLDHKDRQYISVLPGATSADLNQRLGNIGKSTANGIEAELSYVATEALSFDAAIGYIDSDFEEVLDTNPDTGATFDKSDRFSISNTPDLTFNLGATYKLYSDIGDWVFNASYYHRGDYVLFEEDSLLTQDSYGLVNLSINWYSTDGNWRVGLHGKNLTDEEYMIGGYQFVTPDPSDPSNVSKYMPGLGGDNTLIGYFGDPRTVSLTVGYRF